LTPGGLRIPGFGKKKKKQKRRIELKSKVLDLPHEHRGLAHPGKLRVFFFLAVLRIEPKAFPSPWFVKTGFHFVAKPGFELRT
jgi:hypothetical protein